MNETYYLDKNYSYYDPETNGVVINTKDRTTLESQKDAFVHEITHYLQDRIYHVWEKASPEMMKEIERIFDANDQLINDVINSASEPVNMASTGSQWGPFKNMEHSAVIQEMKYKFDPE
jgi:hypothetical protein